MLSFRPVTRSAARATSQFTLRSAQKQPSVFTRSTWASSRSLKAAPITTSRYFSSTPSAFSATADTQELVIKLAQEIKTEQDLSTGPDSKDSDLRASFDKFLAKGWELKDAPGIEEVVLTKTDGADTLRVTFSIADLNPDGYPHDYPDEDLPGSEEEDAEAAAAGGEGEGEDPAADAASHGQYDPVATKLSIEIVKEGKPGALLVEAVAQDSQIIIEDLFYLADKALVQPANFDAEKARVEQYFGPSYQTLDEELQALVEQYLSSWGVNVELASFVEDYAAYKESKEYVGWLSNVKNFFE